MTSLLPDTSGKLLNSHYVRGNDDVMNMQCHDVIHIYIHILQGRAVDPLHRYITRPQYGYICSFRKFLEFTIYNVRAKSAANGKAITELLLD